MVDFVQVRADRELLATHFPKCFAPVGQGHSKRPLKLGIREDILAHGLLPIERVQSFLSVYTSGKHYAKAMLKHDQRVDLDGNSAGAIRTGDRSHAQQLLVQRIELRQLRGDNKQLRNQTTVLRKRLETVRRRSWFRVLLDQLLGRVAPKDEAAPQRALREHTPNTYPRDLPVLNSKGI